MEADFLIYCFTFCLGAVVGSFLNVVILRLPSEGQSIVFPASHCPVFNKTLRWYENIPLLSYLFLLGKCSSCKSSISLQYPVIELLMGILSVTLFFRFGFTPTGFGYFLFCGALLVIIWIDIHHQIIPDVISLPGIV